MDCKLFDYTGSPVTIKKKIDGTDMDSTHYNSLPALLTVQTLTPYRPLSDLTGEITLTYDAAGYAANYIMLNFGTAETPKTKNYFITDRQLIQGGKMLFTLRCDVLTTYAQAILNLTVCCKRTYVSQTPYINDSLAPIEQRKVVAYQEPATGNANLCAHSGNYILITVG